MDVISWDSWTSVSSPPAIWVQERFLFIHSQWWGVCCLVATVVSPRVYQQQLWLLGIDVPLHLFYMDRGQSTVPNVDSGNWWRLSPHLQLCLVLFCEHPRRLHAHKFAFLQFKLSASEFHKIVCTNLKSAPLASFSRLLVDFAILSPGTVQNWTVAVDCSPEDSRKV